MTKRAVGFLLLLSPLCLAFGALLLIPQYNAAFPLFFREYILHTPTWFELIAVAFCVLPCIGIILLFGRGQLRWNEPRAAIISLGFVMVLMVLVLHGYYFQVMNGWLDHGAAVEVDTTVQRSYIRPHDVHWVVLKPEAGEVIDMPISAGAASRVVPGTSHMVLHVRPGAFGLPWLDTYEVR